MESLAKAKAKKWLKLAQKKLGLAHWDIEVKYKATLDARAEARATDTSNTAVITLGGHFFDDDEATQKWTIVHELLHLHTARLCESIQAALHEQPALAAQVDLQEEAMVDAIAKHVALLIWPPS